MIDRNFYSLPENLPNTCLNENRADNQYPLSNFPITRYWHYERRQNIFNLEPPGVPKWLLKFEWLVGWEHGWVNTSRFPKNVFCHPNVLKKFDHNKQLNTSKIIEMYYYMINLEKTFIKH